MAAAQSAQLTEEEPAQTNTRAQGIRSAHHHYHQSSSAFSRAQGMHGPSTKANVAGMLAGQSRNKPLCPLPPPKRKFPADFTACQIQYETKNLCNLN